MSSLYALTKYEPFDCPSDFGVVIDVMFNYGSFEK